MSDVSGSYVHRSHLKSACCLWDKSRSTRNAASNTGSNRKLRKTLSSCHNYPQGTQPQLCKSEQPSGCNMQCPQWGSKCAQLSQRMWLRSSQNKNCNCSAHWPTAGCSSNSSNVHMYHQIHLTTYLCGAPARGYPIGGLPRGSALGSFATGVLGAGAASPHGIPTEPA